MSPIAACDQRAAFFFTTSSCRPHHSPDCTAGQPDWRPPSVAMWVTCDHLVPALELQVMV